MLISEDYRQLNIELHKERLDYGTSSVRWGDYVSLVAQRIGAKSVLDYGCGKGELALRLREISDVDIIEYDPAIEGKETLPEPADMVVCTDVLEHVELECIHDVLDHINSLIIKEGFFTVSTRLAKKHLRDGRNAHILLREPGWWLQQMLNRFEVTYWLVHEPGEVRVTVQPRQERRLYA